MPTRHEEHAPSNCRSRARSELGAVLDRVCGREQRHARAPMCKNDVNVRIRWVFESVYCACLNTVQMFLPQYQVCF